jgi:predicted aldo/keto reductase-like oxidoreductase
MDCPEGVEIPKNLAIYNSREQRLAEKNPMAQAILSVRMDKSVLLHAGARLP